MKKLDESKVKWIILQKQKGRPLPGLQRPWMSSHARLKRSEPDTDTQIQTRLSILPPPMGRQESSLPGCREYSAVLAARTEEHFGAMHLRRIIRDSTWINIPYNKIHQILRDENLASEHPKKSRRRKWVRFERTYSNSMRTRITSCSMAADDSCAMRMTHRVLSPGTASLSMPLPKTRWPCLRRP